MPRTRLPAYTPRPVLIRRLRRLYHATHAYIMHRTLVACLADVVPAGHWLVRIRRLPPSFTWRDYITTVALASEVHKVLTSEDTLAKRVDPIELVA